MIDERLFMSDVVIPDPELTSMGWGVWIAGFMWSPLLVLGMGRLQTVGSGRLGDWA